MKEKQPNNILNLATVRFPVGNQAIHPKYGICKITAAKGALRSIAAPAIGETKVRLEIRDVHVNELKELVTPILDQ